MSATINNTIRLSSKKDWFLGVNYFFASKAAMEGGESCGDVFPWEKQSPSHLQHALGCREGLKSIPLPPLSKRGIYGGLKGNSENQTSKNKSFFFPLCSLNLY